VDDAELVIDARAGSAGAFAAIFDRHAGRVHDFALAALRDRELALEVVDATFTSASQRLHGLVDPSRLGVWLYAIARHECALRAGASAGPDRQPSLPTDDPERADLARLVWEGVAGLPLRDRALIDLDLRHNLDGQDLADALGVSLTQAYDLQGRMRDRTEKALSGFVIARTGVERAPALAKELKGWDGQLNPAAAKKIANVVDTDRACNQLRFSLPSVFALYASALPAAFPAVVRSRVIDGLYLPLANADGTVPLPEGAEPWQANGFPPPSFVVTDERTASRGLLFGAAAIILAVLLIGGVLYLLNNNKGETNLTSASSTTLPAVIGTSSTSIFVATTSTLPGGSVPVATTGSVPVATAPPVLPVPTTKAGTATTASTAPPAGGANVSAPASVSFGADSSQQPVTLTNSGGTATTFTSRTGGASVTVSPASGSIPAKGSASVLIKIDRAALPEGNLSLPVAFDTPVGTRQTTVTALNRRPPSITVGIQPEPGGSCAGSPGFRIRADFADESNIDAATVKLTIHNTEGHAMTLHTELGPKTFLSNEVFTGPAAAPFSVTGADQWGASATQAGTACG
jgi:DNA-directed RNA polymerase specialized sigma24 family protein